MTHKEYLIQAIRKCNNNVVLDPHAVDRAEDFNVDAEEMRKKIADFKFTMAFPNPKPRTGFMADESFVVQIPLSGKYIAEAVIYLYHGDKALIYTLYKTN